MNLRELVILLLGLAMVVVVARGLIVALRARRNQIKLAIDKNIPRDVDLESLEFAELPSGGARIVKKAAKKPETQEEQTADHIEALSIPQSAEETSAASEETPEAQEPTDSTQSEGGFLEQAEAQNAIAEGSAMSPDSASDDQGPQEVLDRSESVPDLGPALGSSDPLNSPAAAESAGAAPADAQTVESSGFEISGQNNESISEEEARAGEPESVEAESSADNDEPSSAPEELASKAGIQSPAEPPIFDEDDFEPFTLSAGDRIGGQHRSQAAMNSKKTKVKQRQKDQDKAKQTDSLEGAGESFFGSARRGLSSLMSKKAVQHEDEGSKEQLSELSSERRAEKDPEQHPALHESELFDTASTPSSSLDQAQTDTSPEIDLDSEALFEGYSKALDEPRDVAGEPGIAESITKDSLPANSADLFPETFDDVFVQTDAPAKPAKSKKSKQKEAKSSKSKPKSFFSTAVSSSVAESSDPAHDEILETSDSDSQEEPAQGAPQELSEVLVINVMARKGRWLTGDKLLPLLLAQGLKFGEMQIFSKRVADRADGEVLFNVANSLKPGTFDLNTMDSFATVGISLFLELPAAINNLAAFEQMLQTARDLVDALDAELRDDQRNVMTGQTIEHYRQRVRDFELRLLRARAAAG